ncbi:BRO-N domain-containing protein [Photobacterium leiognathi]|uniref:BRO-N domain-containing protein n=1 Tax=Photobacterium leiognathi TaxID=553611 RepID=UPI002982180D|nr:BRO family protein [Photobacterium leiognathi]
MRTFYSHGTIFVCLRDVLTTLSIENKKLNGDKPALSMLTRLKAQLQVLDDDEHKNFTLAHPETGDEVCVTEPGLYRLLSRDETPAGKAFQRWIFHEVIPSIREHKQYPPPDKTCSDITSTNFASMDVTETSLQMIAHLANGLIETRKEFASFKADTEKFKGETTLRLENLEAKDELYGLICMDEFLSRHPDITIDRERFLGACANFKLKFGGKHVTLSDSTQKEKHYFDIETLSAAKIS